MSNNKYQDLERSLQKINTYYKEAVKNVLIVDQSYHYLSILSQEYLQPLRNNVLSSLDSCLPIKYIEGQPVVVPLEYRNAFAKCYSSLYDKWQNGKLQRTTLEDYIRDNIFLSLEIVQGMASYNVISNSSKLNPTNIWFEDFNSRWLSLVDEAIDSFPDERILEIQQSYEHGQSETEAQKGIVNRMSFALWLFPVESFRNQQDTVIERFARTVYPRKLSISEAKKLVK